jgi:hypothetical protein
MPPPAHSAATPMPPPRRCRSPSTVGDHPAAGGRDRVAEAAAAAAHVDSLRVEAENPGARGRDRGERLVDLKPSFTSDSEMPALDSALNPGISGCSTLSPVSRSMEVFRAGARRYRSRSRRRPRRGP